jgi:hypothetical protein
MLLSKTLNWLGQTLEIAERPPRRPSARPALEQLEDRLVFTVNPSVISLGSDIFALGVKAFEGTPLNNVALASFNPTRNSSGQQKPASNFTATIDWGDGTTSVGTVTSDYRVLGSHTYVDEPMAHHQNSPFIVIEPVRQAFVDEPVAPGEYVGQIVVRDGTASISVDQIVFLKNEPLPNGTQATLNQLWLSELYRDLFHRSVDASGLAAWTKRLDQGVSRLQVVMEIENSSGNEYRTDVVRALYSRYLHRSAETAGLGAAVAFLQSGGTAEALAASIAASPEYFQTRGGGTNPGFVAALYQDMLGRRIDPSSATSLDAFLTAGGSRTQVAGSILNSPEYRGDLIATTYRTFLDRLPDPAHHAWIDALNHGSRDEAVIAGILASSEYDAKINPIGATFYGIALDGSTWPVPPAPPGAIIPFTTPA